MLEARNTSFNAEDQVILTAVFSIVRLFLRIEFNQKNLNKIQLNRDEKILGGTRIMLFSSLLSAITNQ